MTISSQSASVIPACATLFGRIYWVENHDAILRKGRDLPALCKHNWSCELCLRDEQARTEGDLLSKDVGGALHILQMGYDQLDRERAEALI